MLTSEEIRAILRLLEWKTVAEFDSGRSRVVQRTSGYSEEAEVGRLQAKLSIMLEVATRSGR